MNCAAGTALRDPPSSQGDPSLAPGQPVSSELHTPTSPYFSFFFPVLSVSLDGSLDGSTFAQVRL